MKRLSIFSLLFVLTFSIGWGQSLTTVKKTRNPEKNAGKQTEIPGYLYQKTSLSKENNRKLFNVASIEQATKIGTVQSDYELKSTTNTSSLDSVIFRRPDGFFLPGLTAELANYYYYFMHGPAYSNSHWENRSGGATSYSWTLPDPDGEASDGLITSTITSTEENPDAYYPDGSFFSNPSLTGSDGSISETYNWGGVDSTYIITGGSWPSSLGVGSCNYDAHKNMYAYYSSVDNGVYSYMYGSQTDGSIDAVANYFGKPSHKYVLDSLWIYAGYCTAPSGTEFKIIIHRVIDGELKDTIATATTTIEDVSGPIYSSYDYGYTLSFSDFDVYDEDLGFDVAQEYLEIDDAILVELKGFNADDITFSVLSQQLNTSETGENNAYLFYYANEERYFGTYTGINTSLAFNMDVIYSYLLSADSVFNASTEGETKTFEMTSYYSPTAMWSDSIDNDWLSMSYSFDQESWDLDFSFTVDALPEGTTGRADTVTIYTYGSDFTFYIKQGDVSTGINDILQEEEPEVINNKGTLKVTYSDSYSTLDMFDISGRKIGNYSLPSDGTYSFTPDVATGKGIYLLRFSGKSINQKSVKIVY